MKDPRWRLTLYVSGASPASLRAVQAIRRVCDEELVGRAELSVVDVNEAPALVVQDQVLAVPTLVKHLPLPLQRIVGDLSDVSSLLGALEIYDQGGARGGAGSSDSPDDG